MHVKIRNEITGAVITLALPFPPCTLRADLWLKGTLDAAQGREPSDRYGTAPAYARGFAGYLDAAGRVNHG